jgi:hypothetical protein
MPIYQCAAPVGLLTRDMKARIAAAISGEIVVPFVAKRSEPRHATRAVRTCHGAARWKANC